MIIKIMSMRASLLVKCRKPWAKGNASVLPLKHWSGKAFGHRCCRGPGVPDAKGLAMSTTALIVIILIVLLLGGGGYGYRAGWGGGPVGGIGLVILILIILLLLGVV
jgi:Protein of unknown function (DUF3309)